MHSTNNEGKSVAAERFIRTSKNKIYKDMTAVSKNVYIDKLDDIVNEYNNTYHRTLKMKPIDVKYNAWIDSSEEVNDNHRKFKFGDRVRISWVVPLKDKKYVAIFSAFQNIFDDSMRGPNKIWVDKGSEIYNRSMRSWLKDNDRQ